MSDLIDRDEELKVIRELSAVNLNNTDYADGFADGYNAGVKDAEPKKGRWIRNENGTFSCSVCQSWIPEEQHYYARYCLYCGAKMEKEENEK